MRLTYVPSGELPKLAWCAVIERGSENVYVYHGLGVETSMDFFVEGAWDSAFSNGEFDKSTFFMGTGARLLDQGTITFVTPCHTLERLFSILVEDKLYFSNSLPFILSMSDSDLVFEYIDYEKDFNSILKGINSYVRAVPLKNGRELCIHYYCNISVDFQLNLTETSKPDQTPFRDYNHYHDDLLGVLGELVINAQDKKRKTKYGIVSTISKGYDAAACAAIARDLGCEKCVSFNRPVKHEHDCGDEIAKNLGYTDIVLKSADSYMSNDWLAEAEFVSSADLGTEIVFTAFENEFAGNIVFMGLRGGRIWGKGNQHSNAEFRFDNEVFASTSLTENRLRVGYILLPMPLFGATQWPSISKISHSPDMGLFSIGGGYDRPIPRRILESRGVPRSMFGIKKKGAGFNYRWDNLNRMRSRMAPLSYASFRDYLMNNRRKFKDVYVPWLRFLWSTKSIYIRYGLRKIGVSYKAKPVNADALVNPGAPSYLFHWGVYEMRKTYGFYVNTLD